MEQNETTRHDNKQFGSSYIVLETPDLHRERSEQDPSRQSNHPFVHDESDEYTN